MCVALSRVDIDDDFRLFVRSLSLGFTRASGETARGQFLPLLACFGVCTSDLASAGNKCNFPTNAIFRARAGRQVPYVLYTTKQYIVVDVDATQRNTHQ